jgi:hypothetical protein
METGVGELTILYGCIYGAQGGSSQGRAWTDLFLRNKEAIDALPLQTETRPLAPHMFTVPLDWGSETFWKRQPIHFAASFNNFDFDGEWPLWLDRFEGLLRRMFWWEAHLHVHSEMCGRRHYAWKMTAGDFDADPPAPVTAWTLSGNPRDFYQGTGE